MGMDLMFVFGIFCLVVAGFMVGKEYGENMTVDRMWFLLQSQIHRDKLLNLWDLEALKKMLKRDTPA